MVAKTFLRMVPILAVGLTVASCQDEMQSTFGDSAKARKPLSPAMQSMMEKKGMRKEDPILVRAFKQENTLEIWKRDNTGHYAFLKSYSMCAWGGTLGPKIREGDKQSPEGFYTVTPWRMNPNSQFHLAYDVGYPNAFDRAYGRTGAAIMVHGNCTASAGCFIVTDAEVEEIYGLAREAFAAGQKSFQVQAFPFRMTAENMAKNRRNPNMAFWKNIKQGYDHFEVTKLEPKVDVCEKRYVFDARTKDPNSTTFNASGACPAYEVPSEIASLVHDKEQQDEQAYRVAVAELEDADRKESERLVAENLERSKPPAKSQVASWFGGSSETMALVSEPVPIAVPLPRPSPQPFGGAIQVAAAAPAAPEPAASGGFAGGLFGFGASRTEPAAPASVATETVLQPIAVPLPGPRPEPVRTAAANAAVAAPVAPTPAPSEAPANPPDPPIWKKLNPFGG